MQSDQVQSSSLSLLSVFRVCSGGHGPAALKCRYSQLGATMAGGDESVELTLVDALEGVADSEGGGKRLPDVVVETKILPGNGIAHDSPIQLQDPPDEETYFSIAIQVFIPFLIAGFGMVGAGLVLDVVQASILGLLFLELSLN